MVFPLHLVFPILFADCGAQHVKISDVGEWDHDVWIWRLPWATNTHPLYNEEESNLRDILAEVRLVRDREDGWLWTLEASKSFSVRSCYRFLIELSQAEGARTALEGVSKELWKTGISSKVIIFGWRLLYDSLPTRALLLHCHVLYGEEDASCPLCGNFREDALQLFLKCNIAVEVWSKVLVWLDLQQPEFNNLVDHFLWLGEACSGRKAKKVKHIIWLTTYWSIWLARNDYVFKNEDVSINSVVNHIKCSSWCWFIYRVGSQSSVKISTRWLNPILCLNNV